MSLLQFISKTLQDSGWSVEQGWGLRLLVSIGLVICFAAFSLHFFDYWAYKVVIIFMFLFYIYVMLFPQTGTSYKLLFIQKNHFTSIMIFFTHF